MTTRIPPQSIEISKVVNIEPRRGTRKPRAGRHLTTKLDLLKQKFGDHSVFTRIRNALKEGRTELELYRPNGSTRAYQTTDGLLELIRLSGMNIEPRSSGTPLCSLYVISNLGVL
ncbi:hypothetical protein HYQ37_gp034 [Salmonella phage pertopsoe]|uniref:Uncharacterized protein n=1 Tax=Salmonella phage pertopsoe TaxID=2713310 RepID=A0A6G8RPD8_9CAUD|nr:hypothetical protein HYQ37_gp034 [Salmonella phage pertopsoe]QIO03239.1 hypothetical protein pertopsoe_34 [Salmonella phage pertopsoe]